jgi:adenine-specific DNA-methyltransferase
MIPRSRAMPPAHCAKNMTDAEQRMWTPLRRKSLAKFRFRRQQPIGSYTVDFFCAAGKLVGEIDGGQHAVQRADHDAR